MSSRSKARELPALDFLVVLHDHVRYAPDTRSRSP